MALAVFFKIVQSDDGKQLEITDNTGAYDATDNTGGYGSPNVLLANVTSITVDILLPGGVAGTDEVTVDLGPQLPSATFAFKLLKSQDLGLTSDIVIVDGTYVMDFSVVNSVGPVTDTYHTEITLFSVAGKCVNDMLAKIAATGCDCDSQLIDLAGEAQTVLCAIKYAAICQRSAEVTELLKLLTKICAEVDNCLICD